MKPVPTRDLVLLVADENMRFAMKGILARTPSLTIRSITYVDYTHPQHDPGCFLHSHEFLRSQLSKAAYALVMFDRQGCGQEGFSRIELEEAVERRLSVSGWGDRCAAVVIDPELEAWVWSDTPHVDSVLGWQGRQPSLRDWLKQRGFLLEGQVKPDMPKEAVEEALRLSRIARSSALYQSLASLVGFERCCDPAFAKLRDVLQRWFGASSHAAGGHGLS